MSLELVEWTASWPMVWPYFEGKVPAGSSRPGRGLPEILDVTEYLIESKAATFLLRVDGDSKPVNGSVFVMAVHGEYTVKRLHRGPDCTWIDPTSLRYQPVRIAMDEELHVFGMVTEAIHTLR